MTYDIRHTSYLSVTVSDQCTLYIVQCTMYTVHRTVYIDCAVTIYPVIPIVLRSSREIGVGCDTPISIVGPPAARIRLFNPSGRNVRSLS